MVHCCWTNDTLTIETRIVLPPIMIEEQPTTARRSLGGACYCWSILFDFSVAAADLVAEKSITEKLFDEGGTCHRSFLRRMKEEPGTDLEGCRKSLLLLIYFIIKEEYRGLFDEGGTCHWSFLWRMKEDPATDQFYLEFYLMFLWLLLI